MLAERAAAGAGVPGQDVQQPPDREQAVLVGDRVAVVGGAVAQPLDLVQRVDHPVAADVGPASADQVRQRLPVRGAGRAVVDPQLFEQPFGDLPDQRDRVLRIPVRERADRRARSPGRGSGRSGRARLTRLAAPAAAGPGRRLTAPPRTRACARWRVRAGWHSVLTAPFLPAQQDAGRLCRVRAVRCGSTVCPCRVAVLVADPDRVGGPGEPGVLDRAVPRRRRWSGG